MLVLIDAAHLKDMLAGIQTNSDNRHGTAPLAALHTYSLARLMPSRTVHPNFRIADLRGGAKITRISQQTWIHEAAPILGCESSPQKLIEHADWRRREMHDLRSLALRWCSLLDQIFS